MQLETLVDPSTTAVLCMEMQRGIVGDLSLLPAMAEEIRGSGMPARLAGLMKNARAAGVPVVFCNAQYRADKKGTVINCPLKARLARNPNHMLEGTPSIEVIPELGQQPQDVVSSRYHGMSAFTGTSLDAMLRSLGIRTIIATGVSVNLGIFGMCIEAVGLGYYAVIPRDCTSGTPKEHVESMFRNSLSLIATVTSSEEIAAVWQPAGQRRVT